MQKFLWIIPLLLVAISAPNASADSADPCKPTTTPGKPFVVGTPGKKLTDSADLGQTCSYPGTLTFKVSGDAIFVPVGFTVDVKGPGTYSVTDGPVPEVAATFTWAVTYTPDSTGRPSDTVFEKQVVTKTTPEPGTVVLVLSGIILVLVWKRCASGLILAR